MAPCDAACRAFLNSWPSAIHYHHVYRHVYRASSFPASLHLALPRAAGPHNLEAARPTSLPLTYGLQQLKACNNAQHCLHTPAALAESGYSPRGTLPSALPTSLGNGQRAAMPVHLTKLLPTSGLGNKHAHEMHAASAIEGVMKRLHPPAAWAAGTGCPAGCGACARQTAPPHLRLQSSPPSPGWRCRSGGRTAGQAPAGRAQQLGLVNL